ncbi:TonB-dependent siderophore receptor [Stenotrophomonas sp. PS02298]|uniref:TonB-dependent siderophore receptor n=1 Tax=Stenotrophomonas sp. PS02298 TaxID=2991424 RepID=UPI00249B9163|nr:TonB-dependent siderophore receptor [Stenotrophomonas sp. PS02298]
MHPSRSLARPAHAAGSSFPFRNVRNRLQVAICLALASSCGAAMAAPQSVSASASGTENDTATQLDTVRVVSQRANRVSNGATNLDLDIKETPQSISVVSTEQMQQFGIDNINDALRLATGIQVEEWETNRTNYLARGLEIKNTQIDGVGLPNDWGIVTGAMDAFGYEKLEVIRGANGLLTGVGNASGTINYVRKRPTNESKGQVGISLGSWGKRRVEVDYSTPFTEDGRWAGRVVAAHEDGDSYLRDYETDRNFFYGVVDGQIGDNGTLTMGYSWQKANSDHNMWGALTFSNNDGSQAEWGRSASTTQDWTYWNTKTQTAFVEYTHQLGADWQAKATYNYRKIDSDDQLFFAYSLSGLDPITGAGLVGWAYKGIDAGNSHLGDITVNGRFQLLGHEQEAMFGFSVGKSDQTTWDHPINVPSNLNPEFFPYPGNAIAEPQWGARHKASWTNQRLKRGYGATRLTFTDRFKAVLGFNWAEYHRDGNNGENFNQTEDHISPYAGLTWDFTDKVLGYVSYSDIYQPQDQYDINLVYLDPTKGVNYEVGVKAEWLDRRLLTTLALFKAKQGNLATSGGYDEASAKYWYYGVDVESKGVEFEATGKLNDNTNLVFGYTQLKMSNEDGGATYTWVPRRTANLMLTSRLPTYEALSFGLGGRWQSEISATDIYTGGIVRQSSYALLNAFVAWDVLPNATIRANVNNLTDKKYINSLYQIGYYGAPSNYQLSFDWRF